jgi:hypothetical protein
MHRLERFQVYVFDAEVERLRHAQPAAVKEAHDQVGGVARFVSDGLQERLSFGQGGRVAHVDGSIGTERIHVFNGLVQDLLVEEDDGVERLVLGAGGQCAAPNGGPATHFGNFSATEGPASVSYIIVRQQHTTPTMAIKSITQSEFDTFKPSRSPMIAAITEEVEWFTDQARTIIGSVIYDKTDSDWSYVILGRDERGSFRAIQAKSTIEDRETAKTQLLMAMSKVEASGQTVFRQD